MLHDEDLFGYQIVAMVAFGGHVPSNEYASCCLGIHFGSLVFGYVGKDSCTKNTQVRDILFYSNK
jgi:hypothetical protein